MVKEKRGQALKRERGQALNVEFTLDNTGIEDKINSWLDHIDYKLKVVFIT